MFIIFSIYLILNHHRNYISLKTKLHLHQNCVKLFSSICSDKNLWGIFPCLSRSLMCTFSPWMPQSFWSFLNRFGIRGSSSAISRFLDWICLLLNNNKKWMWAELNGDKKCRKQVIIFKLNSAAHGFRWTSCNSRFVNIMKIN